MFDLTSDPCSLRYINGMLALIALISNADRNVVLGLQAIPPTSATLPLHVADDTAILTFLLCGIFVQSVRLLTTVTFCKCYNAAD